jgi:hypothetical protein
MKTPDSIDEAIGEELREFGGYLQCLVCAGTQPLGDTADKLANGWPKCHGYTMRWWTANNVRDGEDVLHWHPHRDANADTKVD